MTAYDSTPDGDVTFDGDYATLHFEQRLSHPPGEVWEAITDPQELSTWYMMQATIEGREGGTVEFHSEASGHHVTGAILVWNPPQVLEYEWKMEPRRDIPEGEDAIVRWELEPDGDGTLLRLTHRNVTSRTSVEIAPATHVLLERLAAMLDGREMPEMNIRYAEVHGRYPADAG